MAKQVWSDLFRSSSSCYLDTSLERINPTFVDGVAEVPLDIINEGIEEWGYVVV
ncbi:hypothetical protein FRX31_031717, partial [Thalictrum thalictroides]